MPGAPSPKLQSVRRLYRVVSAAELDRIKSTKRFETAPGTMEGKHLWTNVAAARTWMAQNYPDSHVVVAVYEAWVGTHFDSLDKVDGQNSAVFVHEDFMNNGLISLTEVTSRRAR